MVGSDGTGNKHREVDKLKLLKLCMFCYSEVFKAKDRDNPQRIVAMKKVLMDNETEGVSKLLLFSYMYTVILIVLCCSAVSYYRFAGNQDTSKT